MNGELALFTAPGRRYFLKKVVFIMQWFSSFCE